MAQFSATSRRESEITPSSSRSVPQQIQNTEAVTVLKNGITGETDEKTGLYYSWQLTELFVMHTEDLLT